MPAHLIQFTVVKRITPDKLIDSFLTVIYVPESIFVVELGLCMRIRDILEAIV